MYFHSLSIPGISKLQSAADSGCAEVVQALEVFQMNLDKALNNLV